MRTANPRLWDATLDQLCRRMEAISIRRILDTSSMTCSAGHAGIVLLETGPMCPWCCPIDAPDWWVEENAARLGVDPWEFRRSKSGKDVIYP